MKRIIFSILFVFQLTTLGFAREWTYEELISVARRTYEACKRDNVNLLKYYIKYFRDQGVMSEEEEEMIWKTKHLFEITEEELIQIMKESAKWAVAQMVQFAEDENIHYENAPYGRNEKRRNEHLKKLALTPEFIKEIGDYRDVDFTLHKLSDEEIENYRKTVWMGCALWVFHCTFYGYVKVKKESLKKAAEEWGIDFNEFLQKLWEANSYWLQVTPVGKNTPYVDITPPGTHLYGLPSPPYKLPHTELSLGRYGYTTNGGFSDGQLSNMPDIQIPLISWNPIIATYQKGNPIHLGFSRIPRLYIEELGIEVGIKNKKLTILKIDPKGYLAQLYPKWGPREGDILWKINDKEVAHLSIEELRDFLSKNKIESGYIKSRNGNLIGF